MGERMSDGTLPGEKDDLLAAAEPGDAEWLRLARVGFRASTDFFESGIRGEWENAMSRFQSEHPKGSKYHTAAYRGRSKIFRPKTRKFARNAEAMAAKALFSNSDLINVTGQNKGSAEQAASARVNKALLQYRLEHSIPWFVTAMGARQDCFNNGICVSLQTWEYQEDVETEIVPAMDPETEVPLLDEEGNELGEEIERREVKVDRPVIELLPPENLRFDPNADWRNVVDDSPYLIIQMPMYAGDVLERMKRPNPVTGQPEWREYTLGQIQAASSGQDENEAMRQARQGRKRQDPQDTNTHNEFDTVWVHLNIIKKDGKDWAFYTLGEMLMLSDPVPADELLPLGRDSITVGFSIVEAHKTYPIGGNKLAAPLQLEINDVTNQRMDNVKLALNKRYILRRGANVDQQALMRSVPGGGVMAGDPDKDIRVLDYPEVTGSSYQEQDRLNNEIDELTGNFSGASVAANRNLNETVGGMSMLQGDAMAVGEYELRTWIETWVEPVLRKLQKLEAMFETDETVLAVAAENAELFQRYGQDVQVDRLLDMELSVSVNVGMGNTDPMQRFQRFQLTLQSAAAIPEIAQKMNAEEIGKELFALGGYADGERFFISDEEMMERMQKMKAAENPPEEKSDSSLQVAQMRAQVDMQREQLKADADRYEADLKAQTEREKMALERGIRLEELERRLGVEQMKVQTTRDVTALREGTRAREMSMKRDMGSGI